MSEDRRKNMNENIKQEAKTLEEAARPVPFDDEWD